MQRTVTALRRHWKSIALTLFAIVTVVIVVYVIWRHWSVGKMRFKRTAPETVAQLYGIMATVDRVFNAAKIEYWVEGGTMLGAVRSKGIIQWDDDLDIGVHARDTARIEELRDQLLAERLVLHETYFGYKIYPVDGAAIKGSDWKYPALDIFVMETEPDGKLVYQGLKAKLLFGKCWLTTSELYPLVRYPFGAGEVWGPREPIEYLNRCYGDDWPDYAYEQFDHQTETPVLVRVKLRLTPEEREAA